MPSSPPPPPPPPPPNITITPAAATITLYASVGLALTGFADGTLSYIVWSVEKDTSCGNDVVNPYYPQPSCPDGWIYDFFGGATSVTYYAPATPGTDNVYADWTTLKESGQSVATITVIPVNPSVDVTGAWSGTLTQTNTGPPPIQYPATLDLSQDSTGVITGTFVSPVLQAWPCLVGDNTSLPMTGGYVDGTNMYVFGSNESEGFDATINAAVDPSGQQLNGTFGVDVNPLDHPYCPAPYGTIVLTKQ